MRLTTGQALVRFLANQFSERDGRERRLIDGVWGIFGHGNVAGIGQALLQYPDELPYFLARNEQAMVHTAAAYAKMNDRLATYACTSSIGPGATNMVTGAALATVNRLPVLLLPGDTFATRVADPVLQQLEDPRQGDVSVNDALRPVSKYFDRIERPEQLIPAALAAMRVLTDPVETGAVTLCLPQDVQAEAFDWPEDFFRRRVWHVGLAAARTRRADARGGAAPAGRAAADRRGRRCGVRAGVAAVAGVRRGDGHPGGGHARRQGRDPVGPPVRSGRPRLDRHQRRQRAGRRGGRGPRHRHPLQRLHHRQPDGLRLPAGAVRQPQRGPARRRQARRRTPGGRRRAGLEALTRKLADWRTDEAYRARVRELAADWRRATDHAYHLGHGPLPAQTEILGALNELLDDRDVVINAAGSMPGDLQALWRARDPKAYHVEYAYSCMGYEIAAGVGAKLAAPDREVVVLVGDGSYLMMCQELVTAVSEGLKLTVVLVDNGGFASIGALSESLGSQRFGTRYRFRDEKTGRLDGGVLPVDLAANAASLGARVLSAGSVPEFRAALLEARAADRTTVVHVTTDHLSPGPPSSAWWDVPVAEVAELDSTRQAHASYETAKRAQRPYL